MSAKFQAFMILGAVVLLIIIFVLLKRGKMTVKYSLLWLGLSLALLIFAVCPYVVYVMRDILGVEMPVLKSIITLASAINGTEYCKEGRTLENAGYGPEMTMDEILEEIG